MNNLVVKLTDWLIAFCGATIIIWFVITQPILAVDNKMKLQDVNTMKLKQHVQLLTAGYAPRTLGYRILNDAAEYIHGEFDKIGEADYQSFDTLADRYSNVLLHLGPRTKEVFVIGAHYDAENDGLNTEGNASGVASLIELARHIALNEDKLSIGVILVAYPISNNQSDVIENTGSYFHASSLKERGKDVRLMISLDSVGQYSNEDGSQKHPYKFMSLLYPDRGDYINIAGRLQDVREVRELKKSFNAASRLPLYSQNLPENFSKNYSTDHKNYWRQGYSAVLISDTDRYRQSNSDKSVAERLDYTKMGMLVSGLYQVVMDVETSIDKTHIVQKENNSGAHSVFH